MVNRTNNSNASNRLWLAPIVIASLLMIASSANLITFHVPLVACALFSIYAYWVYDPTSTRSSQSQAIATTLLRQFLIYTPLCMLCSILGGSIAALFMQGENAFNFLDIARQVCWDNLAMTLLIPAFYSFCNAYLMILSRLRPEKNDPSQRGSDRESQQQISSNLEPQQRAESPTPKPSLDAHNSRLITFPIWGCNENEKYENTLVHDLMKLFETNRQQLDFTGGADGVLDQLFSDQSTINDGLVEFRDKHMYLIKTNTDSGTQRKWEFNWCKQLQLDPTECPINFSRLIKDAIIVSIRTQSGTFKSYITAEGDFRQLKECPVTHMTLAEASYNTKPAQLYRTLRVKLDTFIEAKGFRGKSF